MALTTGHLLYKNVKAAGLGHLERFDILIALFDFLMIQSKLSIGIVTPYEDLSKVKEDWWLFPFLAGGRAWLHRLSPPTLTSVPCGHMNCVFDA